MAEQFDPYHVWLGIPPKDQPPTHYRLLGIEVFEKNPDAIASAADKQMAHLRTFQTGKHGALSQKLLNEVAAAKICLLNPQKKAAYDQRLRETSRSDDSLDSGLVEALRQARSSKATAPPKRRRNLGMLIGVGAVVVAVLGVIVWLAIPRERPAVAVRPEPKPAQQPVTPREEHPTTARPVTKTEPAPVPPKPSVQEKVPEAVKPPAETAPVRPAKPAPSPQQQPPPKPETPPTPVAPKQKLPIPNDAALEQARKAAEALFNPEIEKAKTSADKVALAKRLLAQALDQPGDAAGKYVLMLTAQDLAVAARDAETVFQVIDQLAETFEVDRFAMKTDILAAWAKEARTPDARKRVVEQMLGVGDEALDAGNLDAAKELGRLATSKMSGLRDKNLTQKLKDYRQRFSEAGKDAEELKEAQATLAQDPKDPQASLAVGRYLCFTKGDWKKGLPLLALGSDETLKGLANQELTSPPAQPDQQVALADGWWEIASTRRRSQTNSIKIHAGQWYRQAGAALPAGLVRNNVEKRLAEVAKLRSQLPAPPPAIAPFDEKQAKQHQQRWAEYVGEPVEMTNSIGMKLVVIPPGEFEMGSTAEEIAAEIERAKKANAPEGVWGRFVAEGPRHRVKMTKPFSVATYPVTQGDYEKVVGINPSTFTEKQADAAVFKPPLSELDVKVRPSYAKKLMGTDTSRYPVEMVTWEEAIEFCRRLSALPAERAARRVYRLPTEAEWEYVCRAGTTTRWSCGDDEAGLVHVGWTGTNAGGMTHPVGEKKPNAWGLYDMYGNVQQWCADGFRADYYKQSPPSDPSGPLHGAGSVLRGSYYGFTPLFSRSACRSNLASASRSPSIGFRVVAGR